jgi:cysteine desulfurase
MFALKEVAVSQGSSCTSGSLEPSHVLRGIGLEEKWMRGSVRFGLGRFTTDEEVDWVGSRVVETVRHLRSVVPSTPKRVVL